VRLRYGYPHVYTRFVRLHFTLYVYAVYGSRYVYVYGCCYITGSRTLRAAVTLRSPLVTRLPVYHTTPVTRLPGYVTHTTHGWLRWVTVGYVPHTVGYVYIHTHTVYCVTVTFVTRLRLRLLGLRLRLGLRLFAVALVAGCCGFCTVTTFVTHARYTRLLHTHGYRFPFGYVPTFTFPFAVAFTVYGYTRRLVGYGWVVTFARLRYGCSVTFPVWLGLVGLRLVYVYAHTRYVYGCWFARLHVFGLVTFTTLPHGWLRFYTARLHTLPDFGYVLHTHVTVTLHGWLRGFTVVTVVYRGCCVTVVARLRFYVYVTRLVGLRLVWFTRFTLRSRLRLRCYTVTFTFPVTRLRLLPVTTFGLFGYTFTLLRLHTLLRWLHFGYTFVYVTVTLHTVTHTFDFTVARLLHAHVYTLPGWLRLRLRLHTFTRLPTVGLHGCCTFTRLHLRLDVTLVVTVWFAVVHSFTVYVCRLRYVYCGLHGSRFTFGCGCLHVGWIVTRLRLLVTRYTRLLPGWFPRSRYVTAFPRLRLDWLLRLICTLLRCRLVPFVTRFTTRYVGLVTFGWLLRLLRLHVWLGWFTLFTFGWLDVLVYVCLHTFAVTLRCYVVTFTGYGYVATRLFYVYTFGCCLRCWWFYLICWLWLRYVVDLRWLLIPRCCIPVYVHLLIPTFVTLLRWLFYVCLVTLHYGCRLHLFPLVTYGYVTLPVLLDSPLPFTFTVTFTFTFAVTLLRLRYVVTHVDLFGCSRLLRLRCLRLRLVTLRLGRCSRLRLRLLRLRYRLLRCCCFTFTLVGLRYTFVCYVYGCYVYVWFTLHCTLRSLVVTRYVWFAFTFGWLVPVLRLRLRFTAHVAVTLLFYVYVTLLPVCLRCGYVVDLRLRWRYVTFYTLRLHCGGWLVTFALFGCYVYVCSPLRIWLHTTVRLRLFVRLLLRLVTFTVTLPSVIYVCGYTHVYGLHGCCTRLHVDVYTFVTRLLHVTLLVTLLRYVWIHGCPRLLLLLVGYVTGCYVVGCWFTTFTFVTRWFVGLRFPFGSRLHGYVYGSRSFDWLRLIYTPLHTRLRCYGSFGYGYVPRYIYVYVCLRFTLFVTLLRWFGYTHYGYVYVWLVWFPGCCYGYAHARLHTLLRLHFTLHTFTFCWLRYRLRCVATFTFGYAVTHTRLVALHVRFTGSVTVGSVTPLRLRYVTRLHVYGWLRGYVYVCYHALVVVTGLRLRLRLRLFPTRLRLRCWFIYGYLRYVTVVVLRFCRFVWRYVTFVITVVPVGYVRLIARYGCYVGLRYFTHLISRLRLRLRLRWLRLHVWLLLRSVTFALPHFAGLDGYVIYVALLHLRLRLYTTVTVTHVYGCLRLRTRLRSRLHTHDLRLVAFTLRLILRLRCYVYVAVYVGWLVVGWFGYGHVGWLVTLHGYVVTRGYFPTVYTFVYLRLITFYVGWFTVCYGFCAYGWFTFTRLVTFCTFTARLRSFGSVYAFTGLRICLRFTFVVTFYVWLRWICYVWFGCYTRLPRTFTFTLLLRLLRVIYVTFTVTFVVIYRLVGLRYGRCVCCCCYTVVRLRCCCGCYVVVCCYVQLLLITFGYTTLRCCWRCCYVCLFTFVPFTLRTLHVYVGWLRSAICYVYGYVYGCYRFTFILVTFTLHVVVTLRLIYVYTHGCHGPRLFTLGLRYGFTFTRLILRSFTFTFTRCRSFTFDFVYTLRCSFVVTLLVCCCWFCLLRLPFRWFTTRFPHITVTLRWFTVDFHVRLRSRWFTLLVVAVDFTFTHTVDLRLDVGCGCCGYTVVTVYGCGYVYTFTFTLCVYVCYVGLRCSFTVTFGYVYTLRYGWFTLRWLLLPHVVTFGYVTFGYVCYHVCPGCYGCVPVYYRLRCYVYVGWLHTVTLPRSVDLIYTPVTFFTVLRLHTRFTVDLLRLLLVCPRSRCTRLTFTGYVLFVYVTLHVCYVCYGYVPVVDLHVYRLVGCSRCYVVVLRLTLHVYVVALYTTFTLFVVDLVTVYVTLRLHTRCCYPVTHVYVVGSRFTLPTLLVDLRLVAFTLRCVYVYGHRYVYVVVTLDVGTLPLLRCCCLVLLLLLLRCCWFGDLLVAFDLFRYTRFTLFTDFGLPTFVISLVTFVWYTLRYARLHTFTVYHFVRCHRLLHTRTFTFTTFDSYTLPVAFGYTRLYTTPDPTHTVYARFAYVYVGCLFTRLRLRLYHGLRLRWMVLPGCTHLRLLRVVRLSPVVGLVTVYVGYRSHTYVTFPGCLPRCYVCYVCLRLLRLLVGWLRCDI